MKKIIIILSIALSCFFAFATYYLIKENTDYKKYSSQLNADKAIYYKLNALSTYYLEIMSNKYDIWKEATKKKINSSKISQITKIDEEKLNNKYCKLNNKKFSIDNSIACVDEYYNELEFDNYMRVELEDIKSLRKKVSKQTISNYASNIIYYLEDMDRLGMSSNQNLNKFNNNYKELKNLIENDLVDLKKQI